MKKLLPLIASSLIALSTNAITISETQTFTGTASYTEKLTVDAYVVYTIGDGTNKSSISVTTSITPLTNNGRIVIKEASELILETTGERNWSTITSSGKVDVYGTFYVKHSSSTSPFAPTVGSDKTLNVFNGGTLKITGVNSGGLDIENGTANFKTGSTVDMSSAMIYFRGTKGTSKLVIEDGVTFTNGLKFTIGIGATATLDLSSAKNISISSFTFKNDGNITLLLPSTKLSIDTWYTSGNYTGAETMILKDFKNDIFNVGTSVSIIEDDKGIAQLFKIDNREIKLSALDANDKAITLTADDYWEITKDGYLNLVLASVPEPAEWAMIFGAIALGLAIYRRRK